MQSFRPTHLWVAATCFALLAVWSGAAPTEIPDEEDDSDSFVDPPVTDLAPDATTEDQPVWPGFGGWSSFINALPRRRPSPGDKPQSLPRSGRRGNQQVQAGGPRRGRGEKPAGLAPPELPDESEVSDDPLEKVFAELEDQGLEGGRFGRSHSQGRRGGKKKVDDESAEVKDKLEGRRSGSRSDKNKVKDEVAETETETEVETVDFETAEPCVDMLETRAGPAADTVAALLDNINNPEELRPILEDLEANVFGVQEE